MKNSTKLATLGVAGLLAIGVATSLSVANAEMTVEKVSLCHFTPPGQTEKFRVIEVPESAVPAHLAHGDLFAVFYMSEIVSCILP